MTTERSDKLFEAYRVASVRFDYFILGVVGALCAFIGQSFHPSRLGWNPDTGQLVALLMFVGSAIAGFKRIEKTNELINVNAHCLRLQEERGALTLTSGSGVINRATGDVYSEAEVVQRVDYISRVIPSEMHRLSKLGEATWRAYNVRNWLLLVGFLILMGARVWLAYI